MHRQPGWTARADRKDVLLKGTALLADGRQIPVVVRDLSRDGCGVCSDEALGIGDVIELNVAPLDGAVGTIRWSLFGSAGVRFMNACA
jgi:hypothetical protein